MKAPGGQVPAYELFLGGSYADGDARLGQRVSRTRIPAKMVPQAVRSMVEFYQTDRDDGEEFKNYIERKGPTVFDSVLEGFKEVGELNRETIDTYVDWSKTVKYVLERGEGECAI